MYPGCARSLGGPHAAVHLSAEKRLRHDCHIQTATSRHSQFKGLLRMFRAIATKYLDSFLSSFLQAELSGLASPAGLPSTRPVRSVQTVRELNRARRPAG